MSARLYSPSQHILRLVSVTETVLPAAFCFSYDVDLTGKLIARVLDTSRISVFCSSEKTALSRNRL